jgi:hypothetical protein
VGGGGEQSGRQAQPSRGRRDIYLSYIRERRLTQRCGSAPRRSARTSRPNARERGRGRGSRLVRPPARVAPARLAICPVISLSGHRRRQAIRELGERNERGKKRERETKRLTRRRREIGAHSFRSATSCIIGMRRRASRTVVYASAET